MSDIEEEEEEEFDYECPICGNHDPDRLQETVAILCLKCNHEDVESEFEI